MNILIIQNIKSGLKPNKHLIEEFKTELDQFGKTIYFEVSDCESMNKIKPFIAENDLTIIAGGDGTVSFFVNTLVESGKPLLVIPTGSGNDFSNSLGYKFHPEKITKALRNFDLSKVSTVLINDKERILTIACFGFEARVNRLANKMPRFFGGFKYTFATLIALFGKHYESLKIESDVLNETGDYSLAIVANSPSFGGGLMISNKASVLDEKMYLILVNRVSKIKLIFLFLLLVFRKHYSRPEFREFEVTRLRVDKTNGILKSQADGESLPKGPVMVKIEPNNLKVLRIE